ncbi:MAG: multiheme c-type cytochrome [Myxococcota bacterium]
MRPLRPALLLLLSAACTKPAPPPPPPPTRLIIASTADVGGDTEPCGCKIRPLGGVARRVAATLALGSSALVLDAGDHFFAAEELDPRDEPQAIATAELLADALAQTGARAMVVGERDLALGLEPLQALANRAKITLLGSNLLDTKSGTTAFSRGIILDQGGLRVGVLGISAPLGRGGGVPRSLERAGLSLDLPGPALIASASALRARGATLIVALLHLPTADARALLAELPDPLVDLAIVGGDRIESPEPELIPPGPAAMVLPGQRGKWISVASLEVRSGSRGIELADAAGRAQASIAAIEQRIQEVKTPTRAVADREALLSRLERRRDKLLLERQALKIGERHGLGLRLVAIDAQLPEDAVFQARVSRYLEDLGRLNADRQRRGGALQYLGSVACQKCHPAEYTEWRATGHGRAFATLERQKQSANLDCVPCHTTGFDRPGGPSSPKDLGPLADVGCEVCHGPGQRHVKTPTVALERPLEVSERVCRECHRDQADQKPFLYVERLARVLGPAHQVRPRQGSAATP